MAWSAPEGMEEYLKPTDLCDSGSQAIKAKAKELTEDVDSARKAAQRIFGFVRDGILFGFDRRDDKASDTLKKQVGFCVTKTNLQVALLRAAGIPARYHQALLTKEALKGILPAFVYRSVPEKIWFHPWCECYLSEKWISCDTLFDKELYNALLSRGITSGERIPTIDWDGMNDLNTMTAWMLEDVGNSASLDHVFRKAQSELPPRPIAIILERLCNRHINKLRKG